MEIDIHSAQQDVRTAYLRGPVAQGIMGGFWLISTALGTWVSASAAMVTLVVAVGLTIPLTLLTLRILGRPMGLDGAHPMNQLIFQIAILIPLSLFLIGPVACTS